MKWACFLIYTTQNRVRRSFSVEAKTMRNSFLLKRETEGFVPLVSLKSEIVDFRCETKMKQKAKRRGKDKRNETKRSETKRKIRVKQQETETEN